MKKDFTRPNGTIKRVQICEAPRKGVSSMGRKFKKGSVILHLSSSRCTGETFVLTWVELHRLMGGTGKVSKFRSPKKWGEQLRAKWLAANPRTAQNFPGGINGAE
jgi:hypothetical protein